MGIQLIQNGPYVYVYNAYSSKIKHIRIIVFVSDMNILCQIFHDFKMPLDIMLHNVSNIANFTKTYLSIRMDNDKHKGPFQLSQET